MDTEKKIIAKLHPSGFEMSDSNFYSLNILNDNNIYYTLCSHNIETHGRVYRYEPESDKVQLFADLGEVTGEKGRKSLPQGKSHTPIFEVEGKIYISTHYGFYQGNDGKEEPAPPPEGYSPYPGGRIIEYDKVSGEFTILTCAPPGEGILTMNMDTDRGIIYLLTWPKGIFMYYDVNRKKLTSCGQVSRGGEVGLGDNYFCLCRGIAIDPRDGTAYFTNSDGEIMMFHTDRGNVCSVEWAHMKKDVFGAWDPHKGGHQGYNWRQILWHPVYRKFFGVHPKSGYLFSFDPKEKKLEVINRICNERCIKDGTYEFFRYGYMTLALDPVNTDILYYISGFAESEYPADANSDRELVPYLTLTTYNLSSQKYIDHGVIQLEDGRYPSLTQSIAIHPNGRIYTSPWIPRNAGDTYGELKQQCDLISFAKPAL